MKSWISFENPAPRQTPQQYDPFEWPTCSIELLAPPPEHDCTNFFELLTARRTTRTLGTISRQDIATLLWHTCRGQSWGDHSLGFPLSLRPAPSAGAIHPIHVLVSFPEDAAWRRYLPECHAFGEIDIEKMDSTRVREELYGLVPCTEAAIISFVAEPGKTAAKYDNSESLVWRDAGILQGIMSLGAAALNIGFCPIGHTGNPWMAELDEHQRLVGVGLGLLGSTV
jgi:hypothetical protein